MSERRAKAPKGRAFEAKREQLAVLVASGAPVSRASAEVGVAHQTARRWLREPQVAARVDELIKSTAEHARKRLHALGDAAVECLAEGIEQGDRLAAIAVLDRIGLHPKQTVVHEGEDLTEATVDELRAKAAAIVERLNAANGGRLDA